VSARLKKAETFEIDRYDSNEFVFAVGGWPIAAPLCARDYAASAEGKLGLRNRVTDSDRRGEAVSFAWRSLDCCSKCVRIREIRMDECLLPELPTSASGQ
jgi:hypothetical protein